MSARMLLNKAELTLSGLFVLTLMVTAAIYWPGLAGPFLLDDIDNLSPLGVNGGINDWQSFAEFVLGNSSGPSGRPVSMLAFLIDAQDWPARAAQFKFTNLMIHLLCGVILFWFCLRLFRLFGIVTQRAGFMALAVAALWLLHPLNLSTTLYVVQRMTQLMTLFALLSLLSYVCGVSNLSERPRTGALLLGLALFPFGLLSVLSKENGALLLILLASTHCLFIQQKLRTRFVTLWFRVGILLPLLLLIIYLLITAPGTLEGYSTRPFTVLERLLTEFRIVLAYVFEIFVPNISRAGLFHDDYLISSSLFNPVSTLLSVVVVVAIIALAFRLRHQQPVFTFAVCWFFGMHLLESTYVPLELYFEHRNYLSMVGPLIATVWYCSERLGEGSSTIASRLVLGAFFAFVTASSAMTLSQSQLWRSEEALLSHWADERPTSSRAQTTLARYLVANGRVEEAYETIRLAISHHPSDVSLLLVSWNLSCRLGVAPLHTLQDIRLQNELRNYRDVVTIPLREFLSNYLTGVCEYPESEEIVAFFSRLDELEYSSNSRSVFHLIYSDLFVLLGELDNALIQLSKAFDSYNNPELIVRQAILSASAGNYENALIFLGRASSAYGNWRDPGSAGMTQVDAMRREITAMLQQESQVQ